MFKLLKNNGAKIGFLFGFLWCLTTAFSNVATGSVEQNISPLIVCFFTFSVSCIFFLLCNIRNTSALTKKTMVHLSDAVQLNFTTLGCWFFWLYSLKYIEPAIAGAIVLGIRPISTIILGVFLYKDQRILISDYIGSFFLFLAVIYLSYLSISQKSAITNTEGTLNIILSLISCVVSGILLSANTIYTKRLSNAKFSAIEILSIRFIFSILILGLFIFFSNSTAIEFSSYFIFSIALLSFSLIIIPQYLFQLSVAKLEPISIAIISPLMPILSFFFQYTDQRLQPTWWTIIGVTLIFFIVVANTMLRYKAETT